MFKFFLTINKILLIFIKKKLKNMETENVGKHLKINQNIWKMLQCIQNANINIQSKFHERTVICLRVAPKTKIDFLKTDSA